MDGAIEISLILSELLEKGLKAPKDAISKLVKEVSLGLFLDDPQDTIDYKMLRVATLKNVVQTLPLFS
jgi:hypothetical protein